MADRNFIDYTFSSQDFSPAYTTNNPHQFVVQDEGIAINSNSDFKPPPSETRLDELASFAIFGLDLKITPQEKVKLIEINGME